MEYKSLLLGAQEIHYRTFTKDNNLVDILILHGWGGKSDSWIEVGNILMQHGYNVIVPDLPGFGKTEMSSVYTLDDYAQTIEEFCKQLELSQIVLWGHSNGGAISLKMAERKNIDIERLILNNSAGIRNDKKRSLKRNILETLHGFLRYIFPNTDTQSGFKSGFLGKMRVLFYRFIGGQDYLAAEKNPFLKQTYLNMIQSDLLSTIKNIDLDTLLIWGEKDTYTPLSDAHIMRNSIKQSKLVVLYNETHGIHLKNPQILVESFISNV